jgi:RND family efflux transporter MFP subunit
MSNAAVCRFPHRSPLRGYAVTVRIRTYTPPITGKCHYDDHVLWWRYAESVRRLKSGGTGESRLAVSVSGVYAHLIDFGCPVQIAALRVSAGDLLRGDRHGILSLPRHFVEKLPAMAKQIRSEEQACARSLKAPHSPLQRSSSNFQQIRGKTTMHLNTYRKSLPVAAGVLAAALLGGCSSSKVAASTLTPAANGVTVGVTPVGRRPIDHQLTVSSELVPYQEIDVYAKESGYIKELPVDYGSRVKKGDLMAVLEIPELEVQIQQDAAAIKDREDMVHQSQRQVDRVDAQVKPLQAQYTRIKTVADTEKGLVAQQEVDDSQGRYLAAAAQLEAARSTLQAAQSELLAAQDKQEHDKVLFEYAKITAPFDGVVTQRYANYGTLVQAGTSSSTNVLPIVRLSEDDRFRLVIPVPESYVKFIHVGDTVDVNVPSLDRHFPGKVTRFSIDVTQDTRTMHTEVDVFNPNHVLIPGVYADATLTLEHKNDALAVPLQAISHQSNGDTVYLVNPQHQIQIQPIQVGLQSANWSEVVSGLKEGDMVVVSDRAALKAGASVEPHPVEITEYQSQ